MVKNQLPTTNEKAKATDKATDKATGKTGRAVLITVLVLFLLVFLAGVGFVAGIYLKFIDLPQLAQNMKLYDYPIIGQYFPQPVTNFPKVAFPPSTAAQSPETLPATTAAALTPTVAPTAVTPPPTGSQQDQLLQQAKEKNKNISKLARLYGGMKPAEAEAILNHLDDATIIAILNKMDEDQAAKVLALFDTQRAADLTQSMLKGQNTSSL